MLLHNLSSEKLAELESFLSQRFKELEDARSDYDNEILENIQVYNNIDKNIDQKEDWEEKFRIPYIWTVIQTIVGRVRQALFSRTDYLKVFGEDETFRNIEKDLTRWFQSEMDYVQMRRQAKGYIERAVRDGMCWLQIAPRPKDKDHKTWFFDLIQLGWFDVYFDPKAQHVMDTDFFVKKRKKLWKIMQRPSDFFQLDELMQTDPPDIDNLKDKYKALSGNANISYYELPETKMTAEVELLEWLGEYDFGEGDPRDPDYKADIKEVIITFANRKKIIRIEVQEIRTRKKRLLFPIRPIVQENLLLGKSMISVIKDLQYELNEIRSLRMDNVKQNVKLLWKVKKNRDIELDELFGEGGNVVHVEEADDVTLFQTLNLVQPLSYISQDLLQDMQQTSGAVDHVMGTSAARGITETASGIKQMTDNAVFKFNMMGDNIKDDLVECMNFIVILRMKYAKDDILLKFPEIKPFLEQPDVMMEENTFFDIDMSDLAERKDVERAQWVNILNVIIPALQQIGGNMKELLRIVFKQFNVPQIDTLFQPDEQTQQVMAAMQWAQSPEGQMAMQQFMQSQAGAAQAPGGRRGAAQVTRQNPSEAVPEQEAGAQLNLMR
jgi:hypothetical protein